jgi:GAF domain-containing protein
MTVTFADVANTVDGRLSGLGAIVQQMFSKADVEETLETVVNLAQRHFGCDAVGVLLVADAGGLKAAAASDANGARAEALQLDHRQGPGIQAINRRQPVIATELRFDSRWRFWAPGAADLGFRSSLSLSLADGDTVGALNLYSRRASSFGSEDLVLAQLFAQQAAIAIAIAVEREQLLRAVDSRGLVGQAQGILMERHGVSAGQAMTVLQRYSTHLNQKLRTVAERVIHDRSLPEVEPADCQPVRASSPGIAS